jgi:menaquinone-9 beta-reductase
VRGYYDNVAGDEQRCDLHFSSESFPGYCWLFPAGGGSANVGVGMPAQTIPPTSEHLRELLLDLVARNAALASRLRDACPRGKVVGWPLATYDPQLALSGERVLLLGDAAGLVNPINGEGIQYALSSARWAAETALPALRDNDLSDARLRAYARRVAVTVGVDMALARVVTHVIANRALNRVWLGYLRRIVARACRDRAYSDVMGGVMAGVIPARHLLAGSIVAGSLQALAGFVAERRNVVDVIGAALETGLVMAEHGDMTRRWARASVRSYCDLLALWRATMEDE